MKRRPQLLDAVRVALGDNIDAFSVLAVADQSSDGELPRPALDEEAEADALDAPPDDRVEGLTVAGFR